MSTSRQSSNTASRFQGLVEVENDKPGQLVGRRLHTLERSVERWDCLRWWLNTAFRRPCRRLSPPPKQTGRANDLLNDPGLTVPP